MWNLLLRRSTLLLALVASGAGAKEREPNERSIFLSGHTSQEAPEVYVVGGIVTVLRLEQPCDPARTGMLAWEGRFEPVVCAGKQVLLEPLRDLEPEDRLMLLVTLVDGTELPFTVTSRQKTPHDRTGDQQVNVFRDREAPKAVLASLYDALRREGQLREEVERFRKEDSVNHALAGLLAKGVIKQTPFRERHKALFKNPTGVGESGQIAVVLDASVFNLKQGPDRLVLELFRQGDGLRQAWVFLDHELLHE